MKIKTGSAFPVLITIFLVIVILYYIPYLAENISYRITLGQVRANRENLSVMQTGDSLSQLFHTVSKTIIPAVVVVQVSERVKYQPQSNPGMNDFLRWYFGQSSPFPRSAPNAPPEYLYKHGLGSGIVIDANNGYILTNWHVVHDADSVVVTLADGRNYKTQWIRTDQRTDLAIIKIDASDLISIPMGDSNKIEIGDWVLAVGAPEGLPHTVTAGIISAKGRTTSDGHQTFLQTDAAINPGNSGGPLANMKGEVIGINTAIISPVGANEGIGLVIPSNTAKIVMKQLIEKGKVIRGYLGVEIEDVNDQIVKNLNLPGSEGALIVKVEADSPAEKAGLMSNDFIVSVDGKKIPDSFELLNKISSLPPGQNASIEFYRKGKKETVAARIGLLPNQSVTSQSGP